MEMKFVVLLLVLPCFASAAIFDRETARGSLDTAVRFISEKLRREKGRPETDTSLTTETEENEDKYKPPSFCNKLDCPKYKVLNTTKNYELRQYDASSWVSTTSIGIDYDKANHDDFMRLFHYISGENKEKKKVAMTAPVINSIVPGQGAACANNFTMSFFVSPKEDSPPEPSDSKVFMSQLAKMKVYVSSFGGFASKAKYLKRAKKLASALPKGSFVSEYFYTAGYDSPFKVFKRHNEVWFIAK